MTTFSLYMHTVLYFFSSFSSPLTKHRWTGVVTVCWAPGTCVPEWGSVIHRCHISCDAHPIKRGWTASPINRSPFQIALCSPTPGSWQQLAARAGHSSPACQSVHYNVGLCCGISILKSCTTNLDTFQVWLYTTHSNICTFSQSKCIIWIV